jgi:hypothetical protein
VTPIYNWFAKQNKNIVGSEFLGMNIKSGEIINGVMHQDLTNLSFENNSFDLVV